MLGAEGDHRPPGIGARQLHRRGRDARAVFGELDHLGARNEIDDILRGLRFDPGWPREVRAGRHLLDRGVDDGLVPVAEAHGAQPHAPIEEAATLVVPHARAVAAFEIPRRVARKLVIAFAVGMRSAGDNICGVGERAHERTIHAVTSARLPPAFCSAAKSRPSTRSSSRYGYGQGRSPRTAATKSAISATYGSSP